MAKHTDITEPPPRVRTDLLFFLTLAVLGSTYVLLIVLLLVADILYLMRAPARQEVTVNFSNSSSRMEISPEKGGAGEFPSYGLSITSTGDSSGPALWNTSDPVDDPKWGLPPDDLNGRTPDRDIGSSASLPNRQSLGKILLPNPGSPSTPGTLVLRWKQPITLRDMYVVGTDAPIELILNDKRESPETILTPADEGPGTLHHIKFAAREVQDLEIHFPEGGGLAELRFTWEGILYPSWAYHNPLLRGLLFNPLTEALSNPEIQHSIILSLTSCTITAIISLWIAVPLGYLLSRYSFFGKGLIDAILDIPIVLPPLVVGLSLLILFQSNYMPTAFRNAVVYEVPGVILAQVAVACAFAVRTMKAAFDQIDPRCEQVALTLGCSRASAFSRVVLPEAIPGMLTAGTLAWARALGEFGPLLIFAGATRYKTEVLSTSVFLELSVGDLSAAVAISLIMVVAAVIVLVLTRIWGTKTLTL